MIAGFRHKGLKRFFDKGDARGLHREGEWAVDVDQNWRITFSFDGRNCDDVNYEDYH
jgi:plasmid maintenance system killer protein